MSIQNTTRRATYTGDGEEVDFVLPFNFLSASDLVVTVDDVEVAFTATGAGVTSGGTVTLDVAPELDAVVVVTRSVPYTQPTHFDPAGPFRAQALESALDRLFMLILQSRLGVSVPETMDIPTSSADTRGAAGDVVYDASYLYIKTASGWRRVAIGSW